MIPTWTACRTGCLGLSSETDPVEDRAGPVQLVPRADWTLVRTCSSLTAAPSARRRLRAVKLACSPTSVRLPGCSWVQSLPRRRKHGKKRSHSESTELERARSRSPFLQHGAQQPVAWLPWGDAAFERARAENRPILLDIGAVWCHWCHVMDRESYEDPGNGAHYQRAFRAGQGGSR